MTSLRVSLCRFAFGDEQKAIDLLRHSLPPMLARTLDWSSLRRLTAPRPRHTAQGVPDGVLFASQLRKGQPMLMYCALQHSSQDRRFVVTDMLDRVTSALKRIDDPAIDGKQPPHVLPLWVGVGRMPFVLPVPLTELFDHAWAPGTPARFAVLLHRVLAAHRLHYQELAGRTLSLAELVCMTSMSSWQALAKFPAELRRGVDVCRDVLDELSTVSATTPAAAGGARLAVRSGARPRS
ncbi:MAG: Rpn family recombination-promoting nuclease/putative transposase [Planctomycetota bacterium]